MIYESLIFVIALLAEALAAHVSERDAETQGHAYDSAQRNEWAAAIRANLDGHPKQREAVTDKHRRVALFGPRRCGKTTGVGTEELARLIENDRYIVWVFVDHLAEFTRNWAGRGWSRDADPSTAKQTGMRQLLDLHGIPYKLHKYSDKIYTGFTFPWGSEMVIHPAADASQVNKARGGACHDVWLDEAQKMAQIMAIMDDVAGPAAKDFRAQFFMTGTPGQDIGSYFHRVSSGDNSDWNTYRITSADNPWFGDSWNERYDRSVLEDLRETRNTTNITSGQMDALSALTEDQFVPEYLDDQDWVHRLPASVRRESLGLWVAPGADMIYPQEHIPLEQRYWADWAPTVTPQCLGIDNTVEQVIAQLEGWNDRFLQLPRTHVHNRSAAKYWDAVLCQDLGCNPDAMAITLQLWTEHDALYEFDTAKIRGLRDDQMLAILKAWMLRSQSLPNISLWGIVVDDDGGATPSMVEGWRHKLAQYLPGVGILDGYKPKKAMQVAIMNQERASGGVRILRNGPIDLEERHLRMERWDPERPGRKRDRDKHREVFEKVTDQFGRISTVKCAPGDDALSGRRYGWWRATHLIGTLSDRTSKPPRMTEDEWMALQIDGAKPSGWTDSDMSRWSH